ncbi:MAG: ABC transporter permease, partial [Bdellovibrionales bacterium]|nr:ABC transporter permease [Bdellovibrionales bacterium]
AMMTTPISPREIILGELIWVSIKGALMASAVAIVFMLFGLLKLTPHFYLIPVMGALIAFSCGSLGLISSALIQNISQFQTVYTVLIAPLFYFSGIFFPMSKMPEGFQIAAHFSPLYHGVVLCQQILWNRIEPVLFLQHLLELIIFGMILFGVSYRLVYRKLYR